MESIRAAMVGVVQRPLAREVLLLAAAGFFMASVGAFNTGHPSIPKRLVYWLGVMIIGGLVMVALEVVLAARIRARWKRAAALTLLTSMPVTVIVWLASKAAWNAPLVWPRLLGLWPAVLLVCMVLNAIRYGMPREPEPAFPAGTGGDPAAFRRRLSARLREAPIYAVEAQDHYLKVHTAAGSELVLMRFADALAELAGAGFQTHRSWWVARDAVEAVSWRRGRGQVRLTGGGSAPVSRTFAPVLREHGWF